MTLPRLRRLELHCRLWGEANFTCNCCCNPRCAANAPNLPPSGESEGGRGRIRAGRKRERGGGRKDFTNDWKKSKVICCWERLCAENTFRLLTVIQRRKEGGRRRREGLKRGRKTRGNKKGGKEGREQRQKRETKWRRTKKLKKKEAKRRWKKMKDRKK